MFLDYKTCTNWHLGAVYMNRNEISFFDIAYLNLLKQE